MQARLHNYRNEIYSDRLYQFLKYIFSKALFKLFLWVRVKNRCEIMYVFESKVFEYCYFTLKVTQTIYPYQI